MLKKYLVKESVADLRREPYQGYAGKGLDPLQETQVLFGEKLLGFSENNGWIYVMAIEQKKFLSSGEWCGYPGWIKAEHLVEVKRFLKPNLCVSVPWTAIRKEPNVHSQEVATVCFGTKLKREPRGFQQWLRVRLPDDTYGFVDRCAVEPFQKSALDLKARQRLIEQGKTFVGSPYMWGGRSAYQPHKAGTSVDCSGLVHLLYGLQGIELARDAHDQFLQCRRCESSELEIGDLIFLAEKEKSQRISHVMLYSGEDQLLEACYGAKKVHATSFHIKFGKNLLDMKWGELIGKYYIFFGALTKTGFSL